MTNEELISKIKAEIERLYDGEAPKHDQQCDFSDGYFTALSRIDEFLDTLESEKPVPVGLEEAAGDYASDSTGFIDMTAFRAFIAGAKWQKQHDAELIEIAYNDGITIGMTKQKEQMLREAVKWLVDDDYDELIEKGRFILGSVGIGYNGYYIPYGDLLKLPKED